MTALGAINEAERIKHRDCDKWGHCKPTAQEQRETDLIADLAIWFSLAAAALWLLAMFGGVKL